MRIFTFLRKLFSRKRNKKINAIGYYGLNIQTNEGPKPVAPKRKIKKFILSFDGGGNKTLLEIAVLSKIEKIIKELSPDLNLHSFFDLFAGTSAGGLNTLVLAGLEKSSWMDLKEFSILKSPMIFTQSKKPFYKMMSAKYSTSGIKKVLIDIFADKKLEESSIPFLVIAFDTITLKPIIISNTNEFKKMTFVDAGIATTAAPVYFNPLRIKYNNVKYNLIDGGIAANNPSLYAYRVARNIFKNADEYHIISLGSYKNHEHFDNTDGSFSWIDITKGYGLPIQKVYHIATEETVNEILPYIQGVKYLRIENKLGQFNDKFKVDSTLEHDTIRLIEIAEKIADENENIIRDFLKEKFNEN